MTPSTRPPHGTAVGRPSLLVIGLGCTGVGIALAVAETGRFCVSVGDDALTTTEWQRSASCLLHRSEYASTPSTAYGAVGGNGKRMKRSQFLSAMLTAGSSRSVRAISPVSDARIVERFDVVVMAEPTLPHAIAFNEHARAVGCAFFFTEARGAIGRIFQDLYDNESDGAASSRSLRDSLLNPRVSQHDLDVHSDCQGACDEVLAAPTTRVVQNAHQGVTASPLRLRQSTNIAHESASEGLLSSSECRLRRVRLERPRISAATAPRRSDQFHVCFQALHAFWQEHGHLPVTLNSDHADEVVRVADDLLAMGRKVPKGFTSQPETIDVALCRRVAAISRLSVPAVSFQLGGLVATAALEYAEAHRFAYTTDRDGVPFNGDARSNRGRAAKQWLYVDELDAGLYDSGAGNVGGWMGEGNERVRVDPPLLEAWLGAKLFDKVKGARVAVIGCGRLGRDFVRCLLLTGACMGPQGRMVFIDDGDISASDAPTSPTRQPCQPGSDEDGRIISGRATVLRDTVSRYVGNPGSRVSAFDGAVQETESEADLWEGVDAVVVCVGRRRVEEGRAVNRCGGVARGGCEALVRFVSHKCVLHRKPLVWGWAGEAGEGGAGVEVMAPGRTSCLICSSHGGVKQLIERRDVVSIGEALPDGQFSSAPSPQPLKSTPGSIDRCCPVDEAWDPSGRCFSVGRSAVAGVMVSEFVKVLQPQCRLEQLRNWRFDSNNGTSTRRDGGYSKFANYGGHPNETRGEKTPQQPLEDNRCWRPSLVDLRAATRPVATIPDSPSVVLSKSFDPFSGASLRAIPAGFTEWGVEDIRPSLLQHGGIARRGNADNENPFSLRSLRRTIFTRFGVDVKVVAAAVPGSECRVGAGDEYLECGGTCRGKILWAEWENVEIASTGRDKGRPLPPKMDQTVFNLWQQVVSRAYHGENGKRASFLFLDIRGVIGEENAVLPVFKYWVR